MRSLQKKGLEVLFCLWGIGIGLWFLSFKSYGVEKLKILTSIAPLYCFCVNIGGDYVTVKNLIFFGAEPHEVSLSIRQMQEIRDSDLIVINGLGMESWLEKGLSSEEKAKKLLFPQ
ncbi:substrate-binding protein of zinc uptake complex component A [Methylacidiphilum kamchatkense Kam1]|uniref:Substrate-binding protein of zinc uptake complex component A n=1 Tax=Methylacidiphilum kamchatkense Kam1 TaxID=1202785 RepID=A0A516TL49_9BACT|nr:zinc ABC transporter substrate-binding protein [Methylacidiphilum kamchatkense]QDQ41969.1 substrate-binding protein of zinc uptake complex component A [Methylacidiphilum kamchatkense Kam1]